MSIFFKNRNQITTQLGAASQAKQSVDDIEVPVELLACVKEELFFFFFFSHLTPTRYVDAGKNPDVYTKEVLEACRSRNEQSFGKITAFEVNFSLHYKRIHPSHLTSPPV